jgi:hypothetical protein
MTLQEINAALTEKAGGQPLNYCEDLNALRTIEKTLSVDKQYAYGEELAQIVRRAENTRAGENPEKRFPLNGWGLYDVALTDPLIRAQTLLKIL